MSDPQFSLIKQIEAAKILREQLADLAADDPEFLRDMIEGETSLHEQIAALVAKIAEDEILAKSIKAYRDDLAARQERIEERAEIRRALAAKAMEVGEIKKIEAPAGTVSVRPVPPKVIVSEEADIPSRFWKPSDPKLDRKALGDALKARAAALSEAQEIEDDEERAVAMERARAEFPDIPGATLSNGSTTISIRSK